MAGPVFWIGSTRRDLQSFPKEVQHEIGYALWLAEIGDRAESARPMHGGFRDVVEIVADDRTGTYRLMYVAKFGDRIYALHAFKKKSKRGIATPQADLDTLGRRLRLAKEHYAQNPS